MSLAGGGIVLEEKSLESNNIMSDQPGHLPVQSYISAYQSRNVINIHLSFHNDFLYTVSHMNEENVHRRIPQALKTSQPHCLTVVSCRFHSYLPCRHIPGHDISLSFLFLVSDAAPRGPYR